MGRQLAINGAGIAGGAAGGAMAGLSMVRVRQSVWSALDLWEGHSPRGRWNVYGDKYAAG